MAGYSALYFPAVQLAGVATATVVSIGAAPLLSGAAHTFSGARVDRRWLTSTSVAVVGMCLVVLPGSHDPASRLGILLATLRGRRGEHALAGGAGHRRGRFRAQFAPATVRRATMTHGSHAVICWLARSAWRSRSARSRSSASSCRRSSRRRSRACRLTCLLYTS